MQPLFAIPAILHLALALSKNSVWQKHSYLCPCATTLHSGTFSRVHFLIIFVNIWATLRDVKKKRKKKKAAATCVTLIKKVDCTFFASVLSRSPVLPTTSMHELVAAKYRSCDYSSVAVVHIYCSEKVMPLRSTTHTSTVHSILFRFGPPRHDSAVVHSQLLLQHDAVYTLRNNRAALTRRKWTVKSNQLVAKLHHIQPVVT